MKFSRKKAVQVTLIITFSVLACAAQTTSNKPAEPDTIGVFFYLDSSAGVLKRLPQEEFKRHTGTGFASSSQSIRVSGDSSPFHFASDGQATFVFKVFKDEEAAKAKLFQFSVKGSEREYELGRWKRRDYTPNEGLTISVAKFGESSFKLTPEAPLAPGEYALTLGPTVFTFSIARKE